MGWGVYDYPVPKETTKEIKGKICVTYDFVTDVPKDWDREKIINDIEENLNDYIDNEYTIDDVFDLVGIV